MALALTVGFSCSLIASEKPIDSKQTKQITQAKTRPPKTEKVYLTGSHLPQDVRRDWRITDGASQVIVIDRAAIERSGASDLRRLLINQGVR